MKIKINAGAFFCSAIMCLSSGALALSPPAEPQVEFMIISSWGNNNYCGEIRVTSSGYEISDWYVQGTLQGTISNIWNGTAEMVTGEDHNVVFRPRDWNNTITAGGGASIGLCGSGGTPTNLSVKWGSGEPDPVEPDSAEPEVLEITDLTSGYYSQVTEKQYMVANTAAELETIENLVGEQLAVDMNYSTVIAAFMGSRSTGGYHIEVTEAVAMATSVNVKVTLVSPGPGCMVTQAFTSPYHVVAIPKTAKSINFTETNSVTYCGM